MVAVLCSIVAGPEQHAPVAKLQGGAGCLKTLDLIRLDAACRGCIGNMVRDQDRVIACLSHCSSNLSSCGCLDCLVVNGSRRDAMHRGAGPDPDGSVHLGLGRATILTIWRVNWIAADFVFIAAALASLHGCDDRPCSGFGTPSHRHPRPTFESRWIELSRGMMVGTLGCCSWDVSIGQLCGLDSVAAMISPFCRSDDIHILSQ